MFCSTRPRYDSVAETENREWNRASLHRPPIHVAFAVLWHQPYSSAKARKRNTCHHGVCNSHSWNRDICLVQGGRHVTCCLVIFAAMEQEETPFPSGQSAKIWLFTHTPNFRHEWNLFGDNEIQNSAVVTSDTSQFISDKNNPQNSISIWYTCNQTVIHS